MFQWPKRGDKAESEQARPRDMNDLRGQVAVITGSTSGIGLALARAVAARGGDVVLNGLGGENLSRQHAINTATLCNETQPDYLSTLVVSFPQGEERFREGFGDDFVPLSQKGLFEEIRLFLEHLELDKTIFRSDHASNYLVLKGTLGRDKQKMLDQVNLAITNPGAAPLRAEWMRGL